MSEITEGKLKVKGGDIYIGEFGKGIRLVQMIPTGLENEEAYATELVRRWNSHDALLEACENFREWWANHFEDFDKDSNSALLCLDNDFEAAIAEAKKK